MRFLNVEETKDMFGHNALKGQDAEFYMTHDGDVLGWSVKNYKYFQPTNEIVLDINNYWARLPKDSQNAIWRVYKEVKELFFTTIDVRVLDNDLKEKLKELYSYMPYDIADNYIRLHSDVWYPDTTSAVSDMANRKSPALTYNHNDYQDLAVLIMMLKPALPIIGQYMLTAAPMIPNEKKEHAAMRLFSLTDVINYPAFRRLTVYCEFFYAGNRNEMAGSAILAGLSSEEAPEWLVGNDIYKKLINAELSQRKSSRSPMGEVKMLFQHTKLLSDDLSRHAGFSDRVREKLLSSEVGIATKEEDKTSVAENYKTKQQVNESDLVSHVVQSKSIEKVALRLDPTLPYELYQECLDNLYNLEFDHIDFHSYIMKWVLSPIVSTDSIDYVDYPGLMSYLALTQALLRHWGFTSVANLMSCKNHKGDIRSMPSGTVAMSPEQLDKLDLYYPYFVKQTTVRSQSRVRRNYVAYDIHLIVKDIGNLHWVFTPPLSFIEEDGLLQRGEVFATPNDLEYVLAELVIYLNEHRKVELLK